ncbi:MAG: 2-amino-4-hydroxy-6-hydroxymethyldihydropteridine diphosphokinase [Candidatus Magnetoovum sp. WYHC-5]|nr:2-amino-4-hydroxy-6-hydroxymethyldihydropteridine diphosphokinase [Candidatus Magnetoovum sp. WYHC-5]
MGERENNCLKAIHMLEDMGIKVTTISSMYETKAWGVEGQPDFMNMCVGVEISLPPRKLLHIIKDIERQIGRVETYRWGPRVVDIDILLYGMLVINELDLIIPHPYMLERDFVLKPLIEIAPNALYPVVQKSIINIIKSRY